MEIERKFRVARMPEGWQDYPHKEIVQGYLCSSPVLRFRRSDGQYVLTVKDKHGVDAAWEERAGVVSREFEVPLSREAYEHLVQKVDGYLVEKLRYLLPLPGGLSAELDVFGGRLDGLVFVEVEFPDLETAEHFCPPDWMGQDVSGDSRYRNINLSRLHHYEEAYFQDED